MKNNKNNEIEVNSVHRPRSSMNADGTPPAAAGKVTAVVIGCIALLGCFFLFYLGQFDVIFQGLGLSILFISVCFALGMKIDPAEDENSRDNGMW